MKLISLLFCIFFYHQVIFNDRVRSDTSAIESAFESEQIILNKKYKLQDHPSFVKAHCAFVDDNNLQDFKEAEALFPHALPRDQFQTGRGRNRMLYLVMHRYVKLREYFSVLHFYLYCNITVYKVLCHFAIV